MGKRSDKPKIPKPRDSILLGARSLGEGPCIRFTGYIDKNGYGLSRLGKTRFHTANFITCELAHGPAPEDGQTYHAAHSCRERACVRGGHLSWKTVAENVADKKRDGTQLRGTEVPTAKLDERSVLLIRKSKESHAALARRYGVSDTAIMNVRSRDTWKHIGA